MKTLGTGEVVFYGMDNKVQHLKGEVQIKDNRVILSEIIYFNGKPNGVREINLPLERCVIHWQPEVYEEIGFTE
jgi:hypothetical protein